MTCCTWQAGLHGEPALASSCAGCHAVGLRGLPALNSSERAQRTRSVRRLPRARAKFTPGWCGLDFGPWGVGRWSSVKKSTEWPEAGPARASLSYALRELDRARLGSLDARLRCGCTWALLPARLGPRMGCHPPLRRRDGRARRPQSREARARIIDRHAAPPPRSPPPRGWRARATHAA